ncbi:MAG: energy-coupling factor transporter transmembrane protein EcfT [Clostridia bacterium]|nr:energy-coupling factor transporter transmembrane protein EcfT [Clostridia bacterium]
MLNDVTFGQYYPTKSFVHKSDPRIKLLALIAYIVALFLAKNFYALVACLIVLVATIIASRVPLGSVLRSIKAIIVLLIFTAVLNLFFHGGKTSPLVHWGIIKIYRESIIFTVFFVLRLFFLVMGSALLTLTTTPVELTDGIESLLTPLKWIKFPVHELALIMSIALRFIPTLIDETNRIISAQKARGADFESGNIFKRIKAIVPILIPLLISAFRRAEELGDAMDARCYSGSKNRTKYKKLKFGWRDVIITLLYAGLITGVVFLNIYANRIFPEIYEYIRLS